MIAHRRKRKENEGSNIYVNEASTGPIRMHYLRKYGKPWIYFTLGIDSQIYVVNILFW